jgi:hypothetical protein
LRYVVVENVVKRTEDSIHAPPTAWTLFSKDGKSAAGVVATTEANGDDMVAREMSIISSL